MRCDLHSSINTTLFFIFYHLHAFIGKEWLTLQGCRHRGGSHPHLLQWRRKLDCRFDSLVFLKSDEEELRFQDPSRGQSSFFSITWVEWDSYIIAVGSIDKSGDSELPEPWTLHSISRVWVSSHASRQTLNALAGCRQPHFLDIHQACCQSGGGVCSISSWAKQVPSTDYRSLIGFGFDAFVFMGLVGFLAR